MKTLEMVSGTDITILDTNSIKILQRCIILLGSKAVFKKLLRSHFSSSSSQVKKKKIGTYKALLNLQINICYQLYALASCNMFSSI